MVEKALFPETVPAPVEVEVGPPYSPQMRRLSWFARVNRWYDGEPQWMRFLVFFFLLWHILLIPTAFALFGRITPLEASLYEIAGLVVLGLPRMIWIRFPRWRR